MNIIESQHLLLLNDSLEYIDGAGGIGPTSPRRMRLHPGCEVTLTSVGFNRNLNTQLPVLSEVSWSIPGPGHSWSNRDITILGYLLSLAPLRYAPEPISGDCPLPSDFLIAMIREHGSRGWNSDVDEFATDLVSRIGIRFREFGANQNTMFGGGYEAELFATRYRSLTIEDVESRERILTWEALPTVDPLKSQLRDPSEPEIALTWGQNGVVAPQLALANTNYNQLILSGDTALRVVTPDVKIPYLTRRSGLPELRWAPPHLSISHLDSKLNVGQLGRRITTCWIERIVTSDFIDLLRSRSSAVNDAFTNGSLKVEQGRLLLYLEGDLPTDRTFLSVVPDGADTEAVKQALLLGAHDLVQLGFST